MHFPLSHCTLWKPLHTPGRAAEHDGYSLTRGNKDTGGLTRWLETPSIITDPRHCTQKTSLEVFPYCRDGSGLRDQAWHRESFLSQAKQKTKTIRSFLPCLWLMKCWLYQCRLSSGAPCMYVCNEGALKNVNKKTADDDYCLLVMDFKVVSVSWGHLWTFCQ